MDTNFNSGLFNIVV